MCNCKFCKIRYSSSRDFRKMYSWTDKPTDNLIFLTWDLYRSSSRERNICNAKFCEIVRAVLDIYKSCVHGQIDRQPKFLQGCVLFRSCFRAGNLYITIFLKKRLERFSRFTRIVFTDSQTGNSIFYKINANLDRLLMPEIYIIQILLKSLKRFSWFTWVSTDRQTNRFFTRLRPI